MIALRLVGRPSGRAFATSGHAMIRGSLATLATGGGGSGGSGGGSRGGNGGGSGGGGGSSRFLFSNTRVFATAMALVAGTSQYSFTARSKKQAPRKMTAFFTPVREEERVEQVASAFAQQSAANCETRKKKKEKDLSESLRHDGKGNKYYQGILRSGPKWRLEHERQQKKVRRDEESILTRGINSDFVLGLQPPTVETPLELLSPPPLPRPTVVTTRVNVGWKRDHPDRIGMALRMVEKRGGGIGNCSVALKMLQADDVVS
jgi:hypothetical protein